MGRYIRDIELYLPETEVENELELFLQGQEFSRTTWKDEICFAASYKWGGNVAINRGNLKELYFFKYRYENGILHLEAWIKDGKKGERSPDSFAGMDLNKPYWDSLIKLEDRLIGKLPADSDLHKRNQVYVTDVKKNSNRKWVTWGIFIAMVYFLLMLYKSLMENGNF